MEKRINRLKRCKTKQGIESGNSHQLGIDSSSMSSIPQVIDQSRSEDFSILTDLIKFVTTQVLKVNLNLVLKQDSFGRTGT
jgi:hypothetical protein